MSTIHEQLRGSHALLDAEEAMNTTAIAKSEVLPPATRENSSPMGVLQMAMLQGADIDKLTRWMELQFQWEANEAKKAFNASMAKFKENPPKITKNKHVRYQTQKGVTEYDHATLDHVCDQITAGLSAVGITHKWIPKQNNGKISVTCLLTHSLGYSDPDPPTLEASPDESGSKNAIQGISSTVTYLERYTLLAAVGMASGMDNDGRGDDSGKDGAMDDGEFQRYCGLIENAQGIEILKTTYMAACRDAGDDQGAIKTFAGLKDKRYKELANASR